MESTIKYYIKTQNEMIAFNHENIDRIIDTICNVPFSVAVVGAPHLLEDIEELAEERQLKRLSTEFSKFGGVRDV